MSQRFYKLGDTLRQEFGTRDGAGTGMVAADALPTWEVHEEGGDTAIRSGTCVAKSGKTGWYRLTDALSTANGYEIFKHYVLWVETVVNGVPEDRPVLQFVLLPPDLAAVVKVNTVTDNGQFTLTDVSAIGGADDMYNDLWFVFLTGNNSWVARKISDYANTGQEVFFNGAGGADDAEFPQTVVSGDFGMILGHG